MKLLTIENRAAKVRLNDAVTPWSADDLIGDIERSYGNKAVAENMTVGGFTASADDALETLEIEINSPGGSVLDGYRIYNALMGMRSRGVKVIATVNTLAASMGSVILMAADEVKIVEGGRIMIHEAAQVVAGNAADHARAAKNLEEISDEIAAIYANRTGAKPEEMRELMKAETWMGAKESVERGFADSIVKFNAKNTVDIGGDSPTPGRMSFLSALFPDKSDAIAKLESEVAENATLRESLATAQAKIDELQNLAGEIAAKDLKITDLTAKVDDFTAKLAERDSTIADLTEKSKLTQSAVAAAAVAEMATVGQEKAFEISGSAKDSKEEIIAKFQAMPAGEERSAFFHQHKSILSIKS
jgi:ATP-dependent Clp endopeptidase proteolytic subunit ClpP